VEHHQRLLALLNVFAKTALHLSVVVGLHCDNIVHDLKSCSHQIDKADHSGFGFFTLICELGDAAQGHARQTRRLVFDHLVVLSLGWQQVFVVVPVDVPALAKVNCCHFF